MQRARELLKMRPQELHASVITHSATISAVPWTAVARRITTGHRLPAAAASTPTTTPARMANTALWLGPTW